MADFVICYDIANPRRLSRVFRYLKKCAAPIQYSVFLYSGDHRQLSRIIGILATMIDDKEDDLRAYPLPKRGLRVRLGRPSLPEGIHWSGFPSSW